MDQKTLLTILLIALISGQLWTIIWDIGKSAIYLIFLLLGLTFLNPDIAENLKGYLIRIVKLDKTVLSDIFSSISKFILTITDKLPTDIKNLISKKEENKK